MNALYRLRGNTLTTERMKGKGQDWKIWMKKRQFTVPAIGSGWFGVKYLYLNDKTRVRYGFSLRHFGVTYTLQRKNIFWNEVSWTYPLPMFGNRIELIIKYLKWDED